MFVLGSMNIYMYYRVLLDNEAIEIVVIRFRDS